MARNLQDGGRANFSKTLRACFLNKFQSNDLISAGSMSLDSSFNSFLSHMASFDYAIPNKKFSVLYLPLEKAEF
jgi:hypothetical protein